MTIQLIEISLSIIRLSRMAQWATAIHIHYGKAVEVDPALVQWIQRWKNFTFFMGLRECHALFYPLNLIFLSYTKKTNLGVLVCLAFASLSARRSIFPWTTREPLHPSLTCSGTCQYCKVIKKRIPICSLLSHATPSISREGPGRWHQSVRAYPEKWRP